MKIQIHALFVIAQVTVPWCFFIKHLLSLSSDCNLNSNQTEVIKRFFIRSQNPACLSTTVLWFGQGTFFPPIREAEKNKNKKRTATIVLITKIKLNKSTVNSSARQTRFNFPQDLQKLFSLVNYQTINKNKIKI